MIKYSSLFACFFILIGCEAGKSSKVEGLIPFDSVLQFKHDPSLVGTENIAKVGDDLIPMTQLMGPSVSLQDLTSRRQELMLVSGYQLASQEASQKINPPADVVLKLSFPEPKKNLADFFKRTGIKPLKNIKVEFEQSISGGDIQLGDKTFAEAEMAKTNFDLAKLNERFTREALRELEGIISRRLVLQESKKIPDQTAEDYIQKNILAQPITISDQEAKDYGLKNNIDESQLDEKMIARLKDILISKTREKKINEFVAKNLIKAPISTALNKPQVVIEGLELSDAVPFQGTGKLNLTLFSSLSCDECKEIETKVDDMVKAEPDVLRLNYLFHFADNDRDSRLLSEAALCVKKLNDKSFWDFLKARRDGKLTAEESVINDTVKSLNLDFAEFQKCFLAREFKGTVDAHLAKSKELGFYRPPVVVIENQVFDKPNYEEIKETLEKIKSEKGLVKFSFWQKIKSWFFGK